MENRIRQIVKLCIDEWDPMRLFPSAPPDEYDSEIEKICSLVYKMNLDDEESIIEELAFNIGAICDYNRENDEKMYRIVANKIIKRIKT